MKTLYTVWLLLLALTSLAQDRYQSDSNYKKIDSLAHTQKYHGDLIQLTRDLTNGYDNQLYKVRAIFAWVTDNIAYDYKHYSKPGKSPECKDGQNCDLLYRNWEQAYLKKVLKKKKAVCSGYSILFKKMCDYADIKCEVVEGYSKTHYYQVGNAGAVNHAWNAVYIDSSWHFLDATWAAGACNEDEEGKPYNFIKGYDNYYWFTPVHYFGRDHYPKNAQWVLEDNYTKEVYANSPYYSQGVIQNISLITPERDIIKVSKGDTIHFKFKYYAPIQQLQVNTNVWRNLSVVKKDEHSRRKTVMITDTFALRRQKYVPFKHSGAMYEFDYVVDNQALYYIDVLFDYNRALRFKVKVKDEEPTL
jgi:transglutaminase-like putative cysteine protease